jgi:hypothetical protein
VAVNDAFVSALGTGLTFSAIVAAAAAVIAFFLIEPKPALVAPAVPEPQASAEAGATPELVA